jgi:cell wall-associated NlpC family hydrolase
MVEHAPLEELNITDELPYEKKLVGRPIVPMLAAPDPLSEHVSQALLGMTVQVLGGRGDWRLVRTWDGYRGWLATVALCDFPKLWGGPWVEVTDLHINLRARPLYKLASITQAMIGTRLPLLDRQEGWVQVLLPHGRQAWTEAHRVQEITDRPIRPLRPAAVVRTARRFLNIPYLWGGCGTSGLDCSGFVQLVLRLHGVELQRDAHQQATQGWEIDPPSTADLVYFGPADIPNKITHVGMMIDDERFIHAAGSDKVRINRLSDVPYKNQLRSARRYVERE